VSSYRRRIKRGTFEINGEKKTNTFNINPTGKNHVAAGAVIARV
jgi:hypothetical protein